MVFTLNLCNHIMNYSQYSFGDAVGENEMKKINGLVKTASWQTFSYSSQTARLK